MPLQRVYLRLVFPYTCHCYATFWNVVRITWQLETINRPATCLSVPACYVTYVAWCEVPMIHPHSLTPTFMWQISSIVAKPLFNSLSMSSRLVALRWNFVTRDVWPTRAHLQPCVHTIDWRDTLFICKIINNQETVSKLTNLQDWGVLKQG